MALRETNMRQAAARHEFTLAEEIGMREHNALRRMKKEADYASMRQSPSQSSVCRMTYLIL